MKNITVKVDRNRQCYVLVLALNKPTGDKSSAYRVQEFYRNNRDRTPCPNYGILKIDEHGYFTAVEVYLQAIAPNGEISLSGNKKTYQLKYPYLITNETVNQASSNEIQLVFENNFLDLRQEYLDSACIEFNNSSADKDVRWLRDRVYLFFEKAERLYADTQLGGTPLREYFSDADIVDARQGILETYEVDDNGTTLSELFDLITSLYVCSVRDTANDNLEILSFSVIESSAQKAFLHFKGIKALKRYWQPDAQYELEIIARVYHRMTYC